MTFANWLESKLKAKHGETVVQEFRLTVKSWKNKIRETLLSAKVPQDIARHVPVKVAGCIVKPHLPGREYWFSRLWLAIIDRTKQQSQLLLVKLNESRLKKISAVTDTDFTQPSHKQPIIVDATGIKIAGFGAVVHGIVAGAGVGAGIGAGVGAAVGMGVGAPVGAAVGGVGGITVGVLIYLWRRRKGLKVKEGKYTVQQRK